MGWDYGQGKHVPPICHLINLVHRSERLTLVFLEFTMSSLIVLVHANLGYHIYSYRIVQFRYFSRNEFVV